MSLITWGSIHQGHKRFSDDSRGRQEVFLCLVALLCEQFLPIREWRCQDIDEVSSSEVLAKNVSIRSKLPTAACWSREKIEGGVKKPALRGKRLRYHRQLNHSQYSSPVEAFNLIVDSKSLPVELNNSTTFARRGES